MYCYISGFVIIIIIILIMIQNKYYFNIKYSIIKTLLVDNSKFIFWCTSQTIIC